MHLVNFADDLILNLGTLFSGDQDPTTVGLGRHWWECGFCTRP